MDTVGVGRPPAGGVAAGTAVRIVAGTQGGSGVDEQAASSAAANKMTAGRATCWTSSLFTGFGDAAFNRVVMVVICKCGGSDHTARAVQFDRLCVAPAGALFKDVTRPIVAVACGSP